MSLTFHFSLSLASFFGSYCTNRPSHICVWMLQYAGSTSFGQLLSASLGEGASLGCSRTQQKYPSWEEQGTPAVHARVCIWPANVADSGPQNAVGWWEYPREVGCLFPCSPGVTKRWGQHLYWEECLDRALCIIQKQTGAQAVFSFCSHSSTNLRHLTRQNQV